MKQLTQNLKSGTMELLEVSVPALNPGNLLVKTHYSLISAGTEFTKVATARKGYIAKAKAKPEQVKQVKVKKLEDYQPGVSRALVLDALKKVAKSPKPSQKHSEQPVSASKGT